MFFTIVIILLIVSVALALLSLWKQTRLEELKKVKRELKRNRVIYHKDQN